MPRASATTRWSCSATHRCARAPTCCRIKQGLAPCRTTSRTPCCSASAFGDLRAVRDGLLTVGVKADGSVVYVTSSVTGDTAVVGSQRLDARAALLAGAADVDMDLGALRVAGAAGRFLTFAAASSATMPARRLVALPTPTTACAGVEVTLLDSALTTTATRPLHQLRRRRDRPGLAARERSSTSPRRRRAAGQHMSIGAVRRPLHAGGPSAPSSGGLPGNPPSSRRRHPRHSPTPASCGAGTTDATRGWPSRLMNPASPDPWDETSGRPTFTTDGNNASTAISEASFVSPDTAANRPFSATRKYNYPWDNTWFTSKCNPANFGTVVDDRNDEAASTTNLFVMHNRMHDWSYYLGFTEENFNMQVDNFGKGGVGGDPELGSSQAGRRTFNGRDNANQRTMQDGIAPITNQYLWQPLAGAFYAPCVDGAYDMAVVAHEYGHAISNRMIAGPTAAPARPRASPRAGPT
jgi:hypothetical protein